MSFTGYASCLVRRVSDTDSRTAVKHPSTLGP
jgi:hypothetical protein